MILAPVYNSLDELEDCAMELLLSIYAAKGVTNESTIFDACDDMGEAFTKIHDIIYRAANGLN